MDKIKRELAAKLGVCQAVCNFCLESCLGEKDVEMMIECIRLDKECSEFCSLAIMFLSSPHDVMEQILEMCAAACEECASECRKHKYEHCRECADMCEDCARSCREYIS